MFNHKMFQYDETWILHDFNVQFFLIVSVFTDTTEMSIRTMLYFLGLYLFPFPQAFVSLSINWLLAVILRTLNWKSWGEKLFSVIIFVSIVFAYMLYSMAFKVIPTQQSVLMQSLCSEKWRDVSYM